MRLARALALLPAAVLTLACGASPAPHEADGIRAVLVDYRAAWLRGDSAAVLRLFAPDAVLLPHHGDPPVVGREAIREFWWPGSAPPTRVTTLEQTAEDVRVDGRAGIVWERFTLRFSWEDDGATRSLRNSGTYLMVLRRGDGGRWLITHRMWDDPVAQPQ